MRSSWSPKRQVVLNEKDSSPQKRARQSPLHRIHVVPMSFLDDAVAKPRQFIGSSIAGDSFGLNKEAYLRKCHIELFAEIDNEGLLWEKGDCMRLVELRGSSGIGKSAFLAYAIANMRYNGMKNFAIFYSGKDGDGNAANLGDVLCSVWIEGELKIDKGLYGDTATRQKVRKFLPELAVLFMDGCSTTMVLEDFNGMIIVAAPPSITTKNIRKLVSSKNSWSVLNMPGWTLKETLGAGRLLGEDANTIEDNFQHMPGIVRYMFSANAAKRQVQESVKVVDPTMLSGMVATQHTDTDTEKAMVHALVRWEVEMQEGKFQYRSSVRFELVSRYAEKLVAEKLYIYESAELNKTRRSLSALSGAESYAGALFEAYAVRKFLAGCTFAVRALDKGDEDAHTIDVPKMSQPIVVESNTLSTTTVELKTVHAQAEDGSWVPRLLWPTTTNFPTFDAYYFHTDGEVYALQMTIASTHGLKNSRAFQTKEYLDKVDTAKLPYKAVFVVPKNDLGTFTKQTFSGKVTNGRAVKMEEPEAVALMSQSFRQWMIELEP